MNKDQIREAQVSFESSIERVMEERKPLHDIRTEFIKYFTPARLRTIGLEDYGLGYTKDESHPNFCYILERKLDGLGRILGTNAKKFGIYYSRKKRKLEVTRKWGKTSDIAFPAIKNSIIELLEAGKQNDLDAIAANKLSLMFKGKILSIYFPNRYLNVFSDEHLDFFLTQLELDTDKLTGIDAAYKKEALVEFKNRDEVMRNWSLEMYCYFLYNYYPGRPPKKGHPPNDLLAPYRTPVFPSNPLPYIVDLTILPPEEPKVGSGGRKGSSNPDYSEKSRVQKEIGDRGEKIVRDMERERLSKAGKHELAAKVDKCKHDNEGFDILSFEEDETPRYIEVKTTRAEIGKFSFFLSANELEKASVLPNYFVYIVFEILDKCPKIWVLGNPFQPENDYVVKKPSLYKVFINVEKKH